MRNSSRRPPMRPASITVYWYSKPSSASNICVLCSSPVKVYSTGSDCLVSTSSFLLYCGTSRTRLDGVLSRSELHRSRLLASIKASILGSTSVEAFTYSSLTNRTSFSSCGNSRSVFTVLKTARNSFGISKRLSWSISRQISRSGS